MPVVAVAPKLPDCAKAGIGLSQDALDDLVLAMGKRLQAEYVEGAIPYLRAHEPQLWARLEALDQEQSLEALMEYERLFFEGLHRYVSDLEAQRRAA
jgi:hypothetical protein